MIVDIADYNDMQKALSVWYDLSISAFKAKTVVDALDKNVLQTTIKVKDKILEINGFGDEDLYTCNEVLGGVEEDKTSTLTLRYIGG